MQELPENLLKTYWRYARDYLSQPKDFYIILLLSLYTSLQLIINIIDNLVFLVQFYKTFLVQDLIYRCYAVRYLVPTSTGNWARYVGKIRSQIRTRVDQHRSLKVLPNRLTPIYSKNHYKEENYLIVKTVYLNT